MSYTHFTLLIQHALGLLQRLLHLTELCGFSAAVPPQLQQLLLHVCKLLSACLHLRAQLPVKHTCKCKRTLYIKLDQNYCRKESTANCLLLTKQNSAERHSEIFSLAWSSREEQSQTSTAEEKKEGLDIYTDICSCWHNVNESWLSHKTLWDTENNTHTARGWNLNTSYTETFCG